LPACGAIPAITVCPPCSATSIAGDWCLRRALNVRAILAAWRSRNGTFAGLDQRAQTGVASPRTSNDALGYSLATHVLSAVRPTLAHSVERHFHGSHRPAVKAFCDHSETPPHVDDRSIQKLNKSEPDQHKKTCRRRDQEPTLRDIHLTAPPPRWGIVSRRFVSCLYQMTFAKIKSSRRTARPQWHRLEGA